jgi:antitoxin component YwqK of YwqJK toxin-antitoxin module
MELTYSEDMSLIDYTLYSYNDKNKLVVEYKVNNIYIVFNYHNNGQLHTKMNYKDGKLNGIAECWRDNGKLWFSCVYKDGKLNGFYQEWFDNGKLWFSCVYKDGKLNNF